MLRQMVQHGITKITWPNGIAGIAHGLTLTLTVTYTKGKQVNISVLMHTVILGMRGELSY